MLDISLKNKNILVTGGCGAIGSNLVKYLIKTDVSKIVVLDNLSSSQEWNLEEDNKVLMVKGDIRNDVDLKRCFNENINYVFHLAAFFANQNSVDYPEIDLSVNGNGTLKLLQYSHMCNIDRFIYASSGCSIYGKEPKLPVKEDLNSMHLSSPYQITKMLGELYCNYYLNHFGLEVVKARFFNSYGPGEIPGQYRNVIPNFIYWAMQGKEIPITGSTEMTRDFTYVEDIVNGLMLCAVTNDINGEEFNLASGKEIKIIELAEKINKLVGNNARIKYFEKRKWDTKNRMLASIDKAGKLLGYKPKTQFDDGLNNTIDWFKTNWDMIKNNSSFSPGMSSAVRNKK